jgi:hypothetical protein
MAKRSSTEGKGLPSEPTRPRGNRLRPVVDDLEGRAMLSQVAFPGLVTSHSRGAIALILPKERPYDLPYILPYDLPLNESSHIINVGAGPGPDPLYEWHVDPIYVHAFNYCASESFIVSQTNVDLTLLTMYDTGLVSDLHLEVIVTEIPPTSLPSETPARPQMSSPAHIAAAIEAIPANANYGELVRQLEGLSHEFRQKIVTRLEPALNAYIGENIPHGDLEGKKNVCEFVERTLEPLGRVDNIWEI